MLECMLTLTLACSVTSLQGSTTGQDGRKMVVHTVSDLRDLVVAANKVAQGSRGQSTATAATAALAMAGSHRGDTDGDE
jgi:hypothetical protein